MTGFFLKRSRYTPISGPNRSGGSVWRRPTTVIFRAEPVSSYTNQSSATLLRLSPICAIVWPANRRPKSLVFSSSHPRDRSVEEPFCCLTSDPSDMLPSSETNRPVLVCPFCKRRLARRQQTDGAHLRRSLNGCFF